MLGDETKGVGFGERPECDMLQFWRIEGEKDTRGMICEDGFKFR